MKRVGKKDLDAVACGFTAAEDDEDTCGEPTVLHGLIEDTWELCSFAVSCLSHAEVLRWVADYTHDIEPPCLDLDARFLVRTDGSSFCYQPEDDAAFQARIAEPDIALVGPLR